MRNRLPRFLTWSLCAPLLALTPTACSSTSDGTTQEPPRAQQSKLTEDPGTKEAGGVRPSEVFANRKLFNAPELQGSGDELKRNVKAFLDWASLSTLDEREYARELITKAGQNEEAVQYVIEEVESSWQADHSRALLTLSILGEMRSPRGAEYLVKFAHVPLPKEGTEVDGEILEQTALATLQGKAVNGLAYMREEPFDQEVLQLAAQHESVIVRAEAISSYLWNHDFSSEAQEKLKEVLRPEDLLLMERPLRSSEVDPQRFNEQLEKFLAAHPELMPEEPVPDKLEPGEPMDDIEVGEPPEF